MKSPCKDCPNKGCGAYHCECEKYLAYTEAQERIRQVRNGILHLNAPSIRMERNVRKKLNREKNQK